MPRELPRTLLILSCLGLSAAAPLRAATYYVAPGGSNAAAGSLAQPFATLQKAHDVAQAGDTVYIRGGTYRTTTPIRTSAGILLSKSGASDAGRIYFWAYPGEVPVFDFSGMQISATGYTTGMVVTGSWLHLKGLEITGVPMNIRSNVGMGVDDCHDNIFESMRFHHNKGAGFFINGGTGGHLILNCDSHDNYDPDSHQGNGQNADGFGVHYQTAGRVTTFIGCRAWWNSDDGWDYISQEVPVITENCWAMANGYIHAGAARAPDGNGAGFKVGSSKVGVRHVVRNCLAWGNKAQGFYANHSTGGNDWINNTAYNNGRQFDMLASIFHADGTREDGIILAGNKRHVLRNNIGFPNSNTNMQGAVSESNAWDLNLAPAAGDFVSVSDMGTKGPRRADGGLPDLGFLKLRPGSRFVDRGLDAGRPFAGAAPDLGAYELSAGIVGLGPYRGASGPSLRRQGAELAIHIPGAARRRDGRAEVFDLRGARVLRH